MTRLCRLDTIMKHEVRLSVSVNVVRRCVADFGDQFGGSELVRPIALSKSGQLDLAELVATRLLCVVSTCLELT
jgi:hypothetical protein